MLRFVTVFNYFLILCVLFLAACAREQAAPGQNTPVPSSTTITTKAPEILFTPSFVPVEATAAVPVGCSASTGRLDRGVITTALLDKPMRYIVYLPPCYDFDRQLRYPVLYLFHGQGNTEDQWVRIGAPEVADQLIDSAETPPFIMVFPFDFAYKQPTEYNFEEVFTRLLVPAIDSNYRTLPEASRRAIGGLSRGGAWALRIGLHHPDLFGSIGGHSPVIFFVDHKSLLRKIQEIPIAGVPRIWLDIGENDSDYEVIRAFEESLNKNMIPHEWHFYSGWHDEKYWSEHLRRYLSWYAQAWR